MHTVGCSMDGIIYSVCVCVCVCVRERARVRACVRGWARACAYIS
jgi:hypothetical protein